MKTLPTLALALSLSSPLAFAWSGPEHEAIADAALTMLKGTPAAASVAKILGKETPGDAATWLDHVREQNKGKYQFKTKTAQAESEKFNATHTKNGEWHFVNIPVGSAGYDAGSKFASEDDVVHALQNAIAVLEGTSSKMTKRQALRVVFHLVGDIHQPLHCATGYYDLHDLAHPKLLKTVGDPKTTPEDRGGNQLYYTKSQEFHALWDGAIPGHLAKDGGIAAAITSSLSVGKTAGDYHRWPAAWASDSVKEANAIYKGLTFTSAAYVPDPRRPDKTMLKIDIALPGSTKAYTEAQLPRAKEQLSKAAAHLAQLLSEIKFK